MSADVSSSFPPSVQSDLNQIESVVGLVREGKLSLPDATRRLALHARSLELRIKAASLIASGEGIAGVSEPLPVDQRAAHVAPDEIGPRVRPQTIDPHAAPAQGAKAIVAGIDVTADEVRATIEEFAAPLKIQSVNRFDESVLRSGEQFSPIEAARFLVKQAKASKIPCAEDVVVVTYYDADGRLLDHRVSMKLNPNELLASR